MKSDINKNKTFNAKKLWIHIVLILGIIITVTPFVWMILTSLKTIGESMQIPLVIFPKNPVWHNYKAAMHIIPFSKLFLNTFIKTVITAGMQLILCSMAAYAMARIDFPGNKVLLVIILSVLMVPSQVYLLPQYMIMQKLNLLNTIPALIIPGIFSSFGTFLLRQFFMSLPKELEEAAIIDGCNHFTIYRKIMLPLARPGLVALAIFTGLYAWNDLMWPLIVNNRTEKLTLSVGLASLQGQYSTNYPVLMAGSLLAIWPMIVAFIIFQKQFIEGIAFTGSKN